MSGTPLLERENIPASEPYSFMMDPMFIPISWNPTPTKALAPSLTPSADIPSFPSRSLDSWQSS